MNAKRVAVIAIRTQHVQILLGHSIVLVKLASLEMGLTVKMLTSVQKRQTIAMKKPNAPIMKAHFFVPVTVDIQETAFTVTVKQRYQSEISSSLSSSLSWSL